MKLDEASTGECLSQPTVLFHFSKVADNAEERGGNYLHMHSGKEVSTSL